MKAGDICKVALIQPDGSIKDRPVLLIKEVPPLGDWIVATITSQQRNRVEGLDVLIKDSHPGFRTTGLTKSSLLKLGMLNTMNKGMIKGKIGELPIGMIDEVLRNIISFLKE
jgi:mRNA interferase MazF